MGPKEEERPGEKGDHEEVDPVEERTSFRIAWIGMGIEGNKAGVNGAMTTGTSLVQLLRMERRASIRFGQGVMPRMAVGTSRHSLWITGGKNFSMVRLIVSLNGFGRKLVSPCHLDTAVTRDTATGVAVPGKRLGTFRYQVKHRNIMQAVTIGAGGGVEITCLYVPPVPSEDIVFSGMTTHTKGCRYRYGSSRNMGKGVNRLVAILASHIELEVMDIATVLGCFREMAEGTIHLSRPVLTHEVGGTGG